MKIYYKLITIFVLSVLIFTGISLTKADASGHFILSEDSDVKVEFVGASSARNNKFGLWNPYMGFLGSGYDTARGTVFNLGNTDQVFII